MNRYQELGEKILSTLIDLYADQIGVKAEYIITNTGSAPAVQEVARCG